MTIVKDPEIRVGPLRVLQRTDGPFIVFDERRKPGENAVTDPDEPTRVLTWKIAGDALKYAEKLMEGTHDDD
jgi:hypothetical protein